MCILHVNCTQGSDNSGGSGGNRTVHMERSDERMLCIDSVLATTLSEMLLCNVVKETTINQRLWKNMFFGFRIHESWRLSHANHRLPIMTITNAQVLFRSFSILHHPWRAPAVASAPHSPQT